MYALWQEIVFSGGSHGGEIFFAKSTDGGKTFDEPVNLSNTEAGAGKGRFTVRRWFNGSLDLVKSKNGTLFATWTEYEGALWISRSDDGGETFSEPMHIDGGDEVPARAPSIATSPEGRVYLAWSAGEGHNADIRYAISDNNGSDFGEIKNIEGNGHADAPRIAADKNGAVHLVYSESPRGLWSSYHIMYARSNDGQTFNEPFQISSDHSGQIQSSAYSSLKLDENGRIYVLWELFPELGRRPHGLGITVSDDGGETFYSPEVVSGSVDSGLGFNGSQQGLLMNKLDVNRHGNIAVVNSTFNRDVSSHIWLFRGTFKN